MTEQLHEHPLAELLHEISETGLSGALRLEFERFKTVVYLADGEVVYAASNLRSHRLSECVRRWQVLEAEQLLQLPVDVSDLDFAAALVAEKLLSREALEAIQARQVVEILRPALLWTTGTWEFDARVRMAGGVRAGVDVKGLLMEAARRLPPEFAASRFSDTGEKLLPVQNAAADFELLPAEAFVLSRVDAPLSLAELSAVSTLPEMETKQNAYTLVLGRLLERERWPRAFSAEVLDRARTFRAAPKPAARPVVSKRPPAKVAAAASVVPPATVNSGARETLEPEELFARLAVAQNYYQVLGVRQSATAGEIKSSYHKLAKRFHPDRFHKDADAALHARIEEAFARVAQAYETLKDKQTRAAYDLKLLQPTTASQDVGATSQQSVPSTMMRESVADTTAQAAATLRQQAEDSFQRGMLALKQGKPLVAVAPLGEAARLAPREGRYRAYYGRALAENEATWRQAEAELKAAITLDSGNASYYVMLAEFYSRIGLPRRARSELDRALAIDSQNPAARQLFDSLQATPKGQI